MSQDEVNKTHGGFRVKGISVKSTAGKDDLDVMFTSVFLLTEYTLSL